MKSESYNPHLKALILQAVDNQIRENTPPITKLTLNRLKSSGYTEGQAREMIASVLVGHIYDALHDNIPFNEKKYERELNELK